jgi:hypothetical protein
LTSIGGGAERSCSGLAGGSFAAAAGAADAADEEEVLEEEDEEEVEEEEEEEEEGAVFWRLMGRAGAPSFGVLSGSIPVARISARRFLRLESDGGVAKAADASKAGLSLSGLPLPLPLPATAEAGRFGLGRKPSMRDMP